MQNRYVPSFFLTRQTGEVQGSMTARSPLTLTSRPGFDPQRYKPQEVGDVEIALWAGHRPCLCHAAVYRSTLSR